MSVDRPLLLLSAGAVSLFMFVAAISAQSVIVNSKAHSSGQKEGAWKQGEAYKRWLDEDVRYIITREEQRTFQRLSSNEQRDEFINAFWERRNPIPGTTHNAFKEEHYRRIAYSNVHFDAGIPGWKTDRGRIYIKYGPPDEIEAHRFPDVIDRKEESSFHPSEEWHYRQRNDPRGILMFKFVDSCRCGDYKLIQ